MADSMVAGTTVGGTMAGGRTVATSGTVGTRVREIDGKS
jgi:hypothetical protein